jgi:hypothetical protein
VSYLRRVVVDKFFFYLSVFKVRMSKFLFDVILMVHLFACGWFFIDCPGAVCSGGHSWIHSQGKMAL